MRGQRRRQRRLEQAVLLVPVAPVLLAEVSRRRRDHQPEHLLVIRRVRRLSRSSYGRIRRGPLQLQAGRLAGPADGREHPPLLRRLQEPVVGHDGLALLLPQNLVPDIETKRQKIIYMLTC